MYSVGTSEEEENNYHKSTDLVMVATFAKDNPVLLSKSKTPSVTIRKEQVLRLLKTEIEGKKQRLVNENTHKLDIQF